MSALVAYGGSDEEDAVESFDDGKQASETPAPTENACYARQGSPDVTTSGSLRPKEPTIEHPVQTTIANQELVGPAGPPPSTVPEDNTFSEPSSPYTSQRATIRNLTLPTNPNLDIPPSPPGSPAPGADQKFAHFLQLKQQDVHFNAKLASSSALKNPSLLPKLMEFAGIKDQQQYATTLPADLWDPEGLPDFAYKEELAKSQKEISKKKEEEKANATREGIEFVSAANSGQSSRGATPGIGVGSKAIRGSAAERVMAGLDRDRKSSPKMGAAGPKKEVQRRGGRMDGAPPAGKSRSPKRRKRSRSRVKHWIQRAKLHRDIIMQELRDNKDFMRFLVKLFGRGMTSIVPFPSQGRLGQEAKYPSLGYSNIGNREDGSDLKPEYGDVPQQVEFMIASVRQEHLPHATANLTS